MNYNINLKTSIPSDDKYNHEETLLNLTNVQNALSTTNRDYHLDDPSSSTSVDANNDHQFSIKCEIDVEENLTEASTTTDWLIKLDYVTKRNNPKRVQNCNSFTVASS